MLTDWDKRVTRKLDKLAFQSLALAGIDWKAVINNDPKLLDEYLNYLKVKKDWIIVNIDYSQLELYVLASISGDPTMIATVNTGKDIHSENTKNIYKIDYEALEKELDTLPEGSDRYKEVVYILKDFKTKRKSTKALSFSLSYGAGKEKIAMDNRISVLDAQKLIDGFYDIYPQVKTWQNDTFLFAIQNGYLETPFGRRRATPKIHNRMDAYYALVDETPKYVKQLKKDGEYWSLREEFKTCKNTPIQSVASDMCSWAAHKFKEWLKKANLRAQMMFWVHDSIVCAVHIDDACQVINRCLEIMENEVKYPNDPVNYRGGLDLGFNYEWTVEVSRKEWFVENQRAILEKKLEESLDLDIGKKFKLVVKSSSSDLMSADTYIANMKKTKADYFEKLVEKLGIDGIHTPKDYLLYMNNCTEEEYDSWFETNDETE